VTEQLYRVRVKLEDWIQARKQYYRVYGREMDQNNIRLPLNIPFPLDNAVDPLQVWIESMEYWAKKKAGIRTQVAKIEALEPENELENVKEDNYGKMTGTEVKGPKAKKSVSFASSTSFFLLSAPS
jgi:hypothetical protein